MHQLTGRELVEFTKETVKIRQHRDLTKQMKRYLEVEKDMNKALIDLSKLNRQKQLFEKHLKSNPEFLEYQNSEAKMNNYPDTTIKNAVKVITGVNILT